jgi:hypothetical protein
MLSRFIVVPPLEQALTRPRKAVFSSLLFHVDDKITCARRPDRRKFRDGETKHDMPLAAR